MKIKEINVSVKGTKNYNSFQVGLTADIDDKTEMVAGPILLGKCMEILKKKIGLDLSNEQIETKTEVKSKSEKCEACGTEKMTKSVVEYSKKNFNGKIYCYDCQKEKKKEDAK